MKIFFQFMIILLVINISFAQTNYYVDNTMGNDVPENGTGTGTLAWKTIEYAINNVPNPTTEQIVINISNGIYDLSNDQIDINRDFYDLTLLGEGNDNTLIQSATDTSISTSRVMMIYTRNNVTLKNLTIRYGRIVFPDMNGGGILNDGGTLSLDYCKVTENSGGSPGEGYGGGIANLNGKLTINNSSITYNTGADTGQGAGIGSLNGELNIYNSTISYNSTKHSGGGIAVISSGANSIFNMENSTVYGNKANHFGGIRVTVFGPQPSNYDITTNINSCTIFNNYAEDFYGGIGLTSPSSFNIKNSIVAGNAWSVHPDDIWSSSGLPISITSGGYNIFQAVSDSLIITGEQNNNIGVDPMLSPLADNGTNNGTQTCALLSGSPAINAIPGGNGAPLMDQRGYSRIGNYDIGAFEYPTFRARVQFVHNSSDISIDTTDVYINGTLAINDFAFRTATPFLDLPASDTLNIGFALANSQSVADTIKNFPVVFNPEEKYIVFANGVLDTSLYTQNPENKSTEFTLFVKDMARETAVGSDVDFFVLHGITDAQAVEIKARELGNSVIIDSLTYGDITSYITAPPQNIALDIYSADGSTYFTSVLAPLSDQNGKSLAVFASGFLDPATNQDGAAFGLFAALADGSVIELPHTSAPTAKVQFVHNSADISADSVDIYINSELQVDNFGFRKATPFIDVLAGNVVNIGIAPRNSTSVADTIKNFPMVFTLNERYVVFANGLITDGYAENPDGRNTDFTLFVKTMARESAEGSGVDLFILHGSTDAPSVDVKVRELNDTTIVDNAAYGDITNYINIPAQDITLDLYQADGVTYEKSFSAPLSDQNGKSLAVFASGFLDPATNQDGAAFGLFAALADGSVIELPSATGPTSVEKVKEIPTEFSLNQNYPNPFNPSTVINFSLPVESDVTLKIFNILGQEITTLVNNRLNAGTQQIRFDAVGLNSGVYFYQLYAKGLNGKSFTSVKKMILTK